MTAGLAIASLSRDEAAFRVLKLAQLHVRPARGGSGVCTECGNPWPCQSRRIAVGGAK
jgi:hypothetical protein